MKTLERNNRGIRKVVVRMLLISVVALSMIALLFLVGYLLGGVYRIAAIVLCVVVYIMLAARAAVFRQRLARWRSRHS